MCVRCVKATKNARDSYGNSEICYVQKKDKSSALLLQHILPEQSVCSKTYRVQVKEDLEN